MTKLLTSASLILCATIVSSQAIAPSLDDLLWSRVERCHSYFEDATDDGAPDFNKIDDTKNGYLKVSGSWPTCGCSCSSTVGAFKSAQGSYTLLQREEYVCGWEETVTSNRPLSEVLPEGLSREFFSEDVLSGEQRARFFYDIEIPRYGTDTKLAIKVIPLGLFSSDSSVVSYAYSEVGGRRHNKSLHALKDIAVKAKDEHCLDYLLNGLFNKLSYHDRGVIAEAIGDDDSRFRSEQELQLHLREVKETYDLFSSLKAKTILLGWNKEYARFYVKQRGNRPKMVSFREFLMTSEYWSMMC